MKREKINNGWYFHKGNAMILMQALSMGFGESINLPHDYMISNEVREDALSAGATGYYTADGPAAYTKLLDIPAAWEGEKIFLHFDGVMGNAAVYVNGSFMTLHHYGYTPFSVDITDRLYYGESNRIEVLVTPYQEPASRWYNGAGIYRSVWLSHTGMLYIPADGIFAYTKQMEEDGSEAMVMAEVRVKNDTAKDHQLRVKAAVSNDGESVENESFVFVKAGQEALARIPVCVKNPALWSAENPALYTVNARVYDMGEFTLSLKKQEEVLTDEAETLFGIRTILVDARHGFRVNGKSIKLRGGCIHHDNGVLGAVTLYDAEYRKVKKLKESGYNLIRTSHNPPSPELVEACDRLGMYLFDEAYDAWNFHKQPGDCNQYFKTDWEQELTAFCRRDRSHPSVVIWSTGNEVTERGGLGDGFKVAEELAAAFRRLDSTRPVSNGICSMWSGLDDKGVKGMMQKLMKKAQQAGGLQNLDADEGEEDFSFEEAVEAFTNCLDICGYNYLDQRYARDGKRYPERVILGTESYPNQMDLVWDKVEKMPFVIGDCTWTAWDYIGEAGLGRSEFFKPDDPALAKGPRALGSHTVKFPFRLANDADFTVNGNLTPQGILRKILWGSAETGVFVQHPEHFGMAELVSPWGFNEMSPSWSFAGYEGKPVKIYVYSAAEKVKLILNGEEIGEKAAGKENRFLAEFDAVYTPGTLEAVSISGGEEVSRASLVTAGKPASILLTAETEALKADGASLAYVHAALVDENGVLVPDQDLLLTAKLSGDGEETASVLAGFGSDAAVTAESYVSGSFTTYHGRCTAVIRSGWAKESLTLKVTGEGLPDAEIKITVES